MLWCLIVTLGSDNINSCFDSATDAGRSDRSTKNEMYLKEYH